MKMALKQIKHTSSSVSMSGISVSMHGKGPLLAETVQLIFKAGPQNRRSSLSFSVILKTSL